MSEFFLELFSEEIPAGLQKNLRENLLKSFNDFFEEKSVSFKRSSSYSTPNRLVILFEGLQKQTILKSEEIKGPSTCNKIASRRGNILCKYYYLFVIFFCLLSNKAIN